MPASSSCDCCEDSEDDMSNLICFQCNEPITHAGDLTMCGSSALHKDCDGGRRALSRAVAQAPDAAELKSLKKSYPLEWKHKELELRMSSSGLCARRRGAAERQLAVKILE